MNKYEDIFNSELPKNDIFDKSYQEEFMDLISFGDEPITPFSIKKEKVRLTEPTLSKSIYKVKKVIPTKVEKVRFLEANLSNSIYRVKVVVPNKVEKVRFMEANLSKSIYKVKKVVPNKVEKVRFMEANLSNSIYKVKEVVPNKVEKVRFMEANLSKSIYKVKEVVPNKVEKVRFMEANLSKSIYKVKEIISAPTKFERIKFSESTIIEKKRNMVVKKTTPHMDINYVPIAGEEFVPNISVISESNDTISEFTSPEIVTTTENPFLTNNTVDTSSNNQSSIFGTTLITNSNQTVNTEPAITSINNKEIDYFSFDFNANKPITEEPKEVELKPLSDDLMAFNFNEVIRKLDSEKEVIPKEDKIELTKVLEEKERDENDNDNDHLLVIDQNKGNSERRKKSMAKLYIYCFYAFAIVFIIAFSLTIINKNNDFNPTKAEIKLDIHSSYQAEIVSNAKIDDNTNYEWLSSNNSVIQVSSNGIITALDSGSAKITVKSKKTRKEKEIKVTASPIEIHTIELVVKNTSLTVGDTVSVSSIVNKDSSIIVDLKYGSTNTDVLYIDDAGNMTALSEGTATIYVYRTEAEGILDKKEITVKEKKITTNQNSSTNSNSNSNSSSNTNNSSEVSISLNPSKISLEVGENTNIKANIKPTSINDMTWTSSNTKVATVNQSGKVTAISKGTANITLTIKYKNKSYSATTVVTVKDKNTEPENNNVSVSGITLNKTSVTLEEGSKSQLTVTISPSNATNKNITWSSSNASVATINNGTIHAIKEGSTTITVTSEDGNYSATCTVTVTKKKEEIKDPEPDPKPDPTPEPEPEPEPSEE